MFPPGIEPGTFRVLGGCDNHYTTETELRSEAGETARLLQAGILCHKQSLVTGQDLDIWSIPHGNGLKRGLSGLKQTFPKLCLSGRDRLVVRTLRCGRSNPGSNPGHGRRWAFCHFVTTPTFMSRKKVWPRRDSNTQPSDLESDALPLRHRVMLVNDCWASQNASSCQTCTKSVLNWNRDWKTTKFRQLFNYCFKWLKCLANVCLIQF